MRARHHYHHTRPSELETRPILVIPFHTPRLPPDLGGLPSIMELLAITGGLEELANLGLTGTFRSDCKGFIRKLLHPNVLRRQATGPGYPLLRYCVHTLCWTRSHPEQSNVPPHSWDQHQMGHLLSRPLRRTPILSHESRLPHTTTLL